MARPGAVAAQQVHPQSQGSLPAVLVSWVVGLLVMGASVVAMTRGCSFNWG